MHSFLILTKSCNVDVQKQQKSISEYEIWLSLNSFIVNFRSLTFLSLRLHQTLNFNFSCCTNVCFYVFMFYIVLL